MIDNIMMRYKHSDRIKKAEALKPATARAVTRLLAESVSNSKSPINLEHYTVAGKTGTSKRPREHGKGSSDSLYASVIGYFPAKDPQLLIYVVVDSAKNGPVWGNTVAAPVFKEVANQCARILNIPPDKNVVE